MQLLYGGHAGENLRLFVALLNGRGDDLAPTLHPQSGMLKVYPSFMQW